MLHLPFYQLHFTILSLSPYKTTSISVFISLNSAKLVISRVFFPNFPLHPHFAMIFNFSGAFWNTLRSYRSSQAFEELLTREGGVELTQVLEEEDAVQEMKTQNQKLLDL